MRRVLLVAVVLPVLGIASSGAPAGVAGVSVSSRGFEPKALSIRAGDTVTWTNTGTLQHQVASDNGSFPTSPVLQPGQSWSVTFKKEGRFTYHDEVHFSLTGSITVAAPPPTVTLGSARSSAVYGGTGITLTGRVSSHHPGETVQVVARACGTSGSSQDTVVTGTDGVWRLVVHPQLTTVFGATWGSALSPGFKVAVAPRIHLGRRAGVLRVQVAAATSLAGRRIELQRWSSASRAWGRLTRVRMHLAGQTLQGTVFSAATLGRSTGRLRALLNASQAAPCYAQSASNVVG